MLNKKALAGTPSVPPAFVEDVFSTFLYTGNGSTQTITNNIDLAGKGGLTWIKQRSPENNILTDTSRGVLNVLRSNTNAAQETIANSLTAFSSSGFSVGSSYRVNDGGSNYCSWTFREQPKFMDVVTWTGNDTAGRTVAHNLGSVPGMIFVKCTSNETYWAVHHRSLGGTKGLYLNETDVAATSSSFWNNTDPTSTQFSLGNWNAVNGSGRTYVAYLFAHNAGGFGTTGTDNVISCGSFVHDNSIDQFINIGYEAQYVLVKGVDTATGWSIMDVMRGAPTGGNTQLLFANTTGAESAGQQCYPTSTGFAVRSGAFVNGTTHIYMAIRRPMKVPTTGTQVYNGITRTGTGATAAITGVGFAPDALFSTKRGGGIGTLLWDKLRGRTLALYARLTVEDYNSADGVTAYGMDGVSVDADTNTQGINQNASTYINHFFRRSSGFFDEVCFNGSPSFSTLTHNHNLGVAPELIIAKYRDRASPFYVYAAPLGATKYLRLNNTDAETTASGVWNNTVPTSTTFTTGSFFQNGAPNAAVAYLFASVAGVSKVGSYTGNGSSQTINCGFTAGARFVLIKRTDSTGDWVVLDTARGIVSGNDPFIELNTSTAEQTGEDIVDPDNSGFIVNSTTENINASGGTYLFLAIA